MNALIPYDRNSGTREETFLEIQSIFKSVQSFIHPWNEFAESVVKERKEDGEIEYRNTHEAHDFFNVEAIISSSRAWLFNFRLGTFGSIPNILTGLGIVGTFFGILTGIPESVAADAISKGIPQFMVGMKGAFLASLAGLISALVFTFIEKYLTDIMESQCRLLAERLDTVFRRRTSQDYLSELAYSSMQQLAAMKNLPLNFGKEVIKGLTGAGVETVEISDSVRAGVAMGFEQLVKGLNDFNTFQGEFVKNIQGIQREQSTIASNFAQLNQSAVECATTIRGASATLMEAATEVRSMVAKLSEVTIVSRDTLEGQKESAQAIKESIQTAEKSIFEFHKTQTTIVSSLGETVSSFKVANDSFSQQVADYHQSLNTSLKTNLETFEDHLGTGVKKLGGGVNSLGDMLVELNGALTDANKVYRQLSLVKNDDESKT
ncbi:hypothetical protein ACLSU7_13035 [Bdellovibrio sp. HCB185ZH]|uniref:hypothetical protein n=1 Tax=Bdellovibrio sp. HCB185ZH TaxID=3394235 RepID=UPI0039A48FE5